MHYLLLISIINFIYKEINLIYLDKFLWLIYNIIIYNYLFLIYFTLLYKSNKLFSFIFRINLNIFIFIEKILHFYISNNYIYFGKYNKYILSKIKENIYL